MLRGAVWIDWEMRHENERDLFYDEHDFDESSS